MLAVSCLVPITTQARAARLEVAGCSRYAKPTVKTTYTAEGMKVAFHFDKCIESGDPTMVGAGLSRTSLDGTGAARLMAQTCDSTWPCRLVVRMPHSDPELAQYEFNVTWTGLNGREQTWESSPTWCTTTPILARCVETPIP